MLNIVFGCFENFRFCTQYRTGYQKVYNGQPRTPRGEKHAMKLEKGNWCQSMDSFNSLTEFGCQQVPFGLLCAKVQLQ